MTYLVLDVGTSGCKAAVISPDGRTLATARRGYALLCPEPGCAELDPQEVWRAVCQALAEIAPHARDARAMAISSMGESFVLLDREDEVLCNSMTYLDQRGRDELAEIAEFIDEDALHRATGTQLSEMYSLPKWLWLRKNRPEVAARARKLMLFSDYIGYRLTAERVIDPSLASRTMLLDMRSLRWHDGLLARFGLTCEMLSDVRPSGAQVGTLLPEIARELGLPTNMTLFAGCHDQCCATLGAGVLAEGGVMAGEGSSESVIMLVGRDKGLPPSGEMARLRLSFEPFVDASLFAITLGQAAYGTCLKWFAEFLEPELRAQCEAEGASVFEALDASCAEDTRGVVFLPYLAGVHPMFPDMRAEGAFLGLGLGTDKKAMYRAVLEGLCFETRINCELLESLGARPERIVATGGCTRSALHMQIKANALRMPVCVPDTPDAGLTGLAMMCAVAMGACANYAVAAERFVRFCASYEPCDGSEPCDGVKARFRKYRALREAIINAYARMP